jgi:hypothetical protein
MQPGTKPLPNGEHFRALEIDLAIQLHQQLHGLKLSIA